jgi:hypothetical protein
MKRIVKWLIPLALLALMIISFSLSARLTELCPSISLRYDTPLTAEQVEWSGAYTAEYGAPYLTFWTESQTFVSVEDMGASAAQILYNGNSDISYPVTYRNGNAPGMDQNACSISASLAWELWGSDRVVGMTLKIDGKEYTVCGVFEEEDNRLFRWAASGFTAVEIPDTPKGKDSYRYALDLAAQSGLGYPTGILWGSGMAEIGRMLCWLPLALAGCFLIIPYLAQLKKIPGIVWAILALILVLALPAIIDVLPGWMVPTRWSDFGFYGRLWDTFRDRWHDLLMLSPTPMDAQRKALFLGLLLNSCGCCVLTVELKRAFFLR